MLTTLLRHWLDQTGHLQALGLTAPAGSATLQKVSVQNFGPGKTGAGSTVEADYSRLKLDSKGGVTGGSVGLESAFQGKQLSKSSAHFGNSGRPAKIYSTIYDRHQGGVHQHIAMDLGELEWFGNRITGGKLKISVNGAGQGKLADARIAYEKELLSGAEITNYKSDGKGELESRARLDFSTVRFLGNEIIGGFASGRNMRADNTLHSTSKMVYTTLGLPSSISIEIYDTNGETLKSSIFYNYSGVAFNALREVASGTLKMTVKAGTGRLMARTTIDYQDTLPVNHHTTHYGKSGAPTGTTSIDYAGSSFNHDKRVINGNIDVLQKDAEGTLRTKTTTLYGADGMPASSCAVRYDKDGQTVLSKTDTDYSHAGFDRSARVASGRTVAQSNGAGWATTVTTTYLGQGQARTRETKSVREGTGQNYSKTVKRPDGTVFQVITARKDSSGKPISGTVTDYGTDGTTVIKHETLDYSGIQFSGQTFTGGSISYDAHDGKNRLTSSNTASFR